MSRKTTSNIDFYEALLQEDNDPIILNKNHLALTEDEIIRIIDSKGIFEDNQDLLTSKELATHLLELAKIRSVITHEEFEFVKKAIYFDDFTWQAFANDLKSGDRSSAFRRFKRITGLIADYYKSSK